MSDRKILLIEDNHDDIELTTRAFRKHNLVNTIDIAKDGISAIKYLKEKTDPPSAVLLDKKLPRVNGLEVSQSIRRNESTRSLPVAILTSSQEERDPIEGYRLDTNSFVKKPVDFAQTHGRSQGVGVIRAYIELEPLQVMK